MKAHQVLLPVLLVVGAGQCLALNLIAGRAGRTVTADCPEPPACPSAATAAPAGVDGKPTGSARQGVSKVAADDAEGQSDTAAPPPPPPGAIQLPFAPQSALFDPSARREMFKIARAMKDDPSKKIKLIGHSDLVTDGERAPGIGQRRAKSCHDFIVQLGVENPRVSYEVRPPSKSTNAAEGGRYRAVTAIWE
jgi:outer membrane protein OmpA-like peptidoglycan-associated protein